MKVIWTGNAARQADEIYDFIARQSPAAAMKFYNHLLEEAAKLAVFPQMAPIERFLDDHPAKFRSLLVRRTHKIIYFIDSEAVNIVAVWDCRQNPQTLKKQITK